LLLLPQYIPNSKIPDLCTCPGLYQMLITQPGYTLPYLSYSIALRDNILFHPFLLMGLPLHSPLAHHPPWLSHTHISHAHGTCNIFSPWLFFFTVKVMTQQSFRTSGTTHQRRQHHIPDT